MTILTLIGRATSINVRKVLWTCRELDLPCRLDEGPADPARRDALLALNPAGQYPVLLDDRLAAPLTQSNAICRYLATRQGRDDLLPVAPGARAVVEQWMDWQATDLNGAWRYAFMALVRRAPGFGHAADVAASVAAWNAAMVLLDRRLAQTGAHVAGAAFTLADIVLGLSVNRWRLSPIARPALPAVEDYWRRLGSRPGFADHVDNGVP
ncbi:MAG: glutathione S-transferase N-terminal domain-containing protein [Azospirillaceae bacterium]|nr:glutathione S-transferase N-terminal domain-containing protein [Azospirillaceae bacterium]